MTRRDDPDILSAYQIDDDTLQQLYQWVDEIPLSRTKKNIARDFSDGVLMAEVVKHFLPKIVDLHNYSSANSLSQKMYNWETLNQKVLKRIGLVLQLPHIENVCYCVPGSVEFILLEFQKAYSRFRKNRRKHAVDASPSPASSVTAASHTPMPAPAASTPPAGYPPMDYGLARPEAYPHPQFAEAASTYTPQGQHPGSAVHRGRIPEDVQTAPSMGTAPPTTGQTDASHTTLDTRTLEVDTEILLEKEQTIQELRGTVEILEQKIRKLEQLVRLKDSRIQALNTKLQQAGL
eukprot:gnl/Trimastix_PCT/2873.p1 GENE.gnl/Trimastix_PCT/2873~~gnl/Trimastix_PCT/2873.p1  ORF type:complete len:291 (+),score=59.76 gnl/Trimastix_PCT/2873:65-937(+)